MCSEEFRKDSHESTCVRVSFLIKLDAVHLQLHLKRDSSTGSSCGFLEICKSTIFAERYWTAASDYISINSGDKGTGKRNCKL